MQKHITIGKNGVKQVIVGNDLPFTLIAGPCVIESEKITMETAEKLAEITARLGIPFIFKSSFDKANRSSIDSYRGPGMKKGLNILAKVRRTFGVPIFTDLHDVDQVEEVAKIADCLQIPAFLSRQTDLIVACAKTGLPINIKKGQFLAPEQMKNAINKSLSVGNSNIMLCERGFSFGYNDLIVDMRSFPIMAKKGFPVIFDATHSVQIPGGLGTSTGGRREFIETLARAALATGIAGLFMEIHPDPDNALCDGPNMIPLDRIEELLTIIKKFDNLAKTNPLIGIK